MCEFELCIRPAWQGNARINVQIGLNLTCNFAETHAKPLLSIPPSACTYILDLCDLNLFKSPLQHPLVLEPKRFCKFSLRNNQGINAIQTFSQRHNPGWDSKKDENTLLWYVWGPNSEATP